MKTISSQRFLNEDLVNQKISHSDFDVFVSPVFEFEGAEYRVLLDGHHSFAAAKESNNDPIFIEMDSSQHDAIGLEPGLFLEVVHMGDDYYDTETGIDVW